MVHIVPDYFSDKFVYGANLHIRNIRSKDSLDLEFYAKSIGQRSVTCCGATCSLGNNKWK